MDAAAPTPTPDILGEPWVARRIPVTDAAAAPGNDGGNLGGQSLDRSADTEGGRQTAPQETPKAETAETAGAQGVN